MIPCLCRPKKSTRFSRPSWRQRTFEQSYLTKRQTDLSRTKFPMSRSSVSIGRSTLSRNTCLAKSLKRCSDHMQKSLFRWDFEQQKSAVTPTTPARSYPAAASPTVSGNRNRRVRKARRQNLNASELARLKQDQDIVETFESEFEKMQSVYQS